MYYVYWIKAKEHTDPFTQGYIGKSKNPERRFRNHTTDISKGGSKIVKEYFKRFGRDSLELVILEKYDTEEEALEREKFYRPEYGIAWNITKGGLKTPDCTGQIQSKETREKRSRSVKSTKAQRSYTNPWKGRKDRYTEEQRKHLGSFHKGKTISESHKKAIKEKISGDKSPVAIPITLKDLWTNKIYNFGSLIVAATELNIGYSALRSALRCNRDIVYKRWFIVRQGTE